LAALKFVAFWRTMGWIQSNLRDRSNILAGSKSQELMEKIRVEARVYLCEAKS